MGKPSTAASSLSSDGDLLMLLLASIVLALVVAHWLRNPSQEQRRGGGGGGGGRSHTHTQQQQQAQRGGGKGARGGLIHLRPMSMRAKALQKELSLPFGSAVTMTTKGVLFHTAGGGEGSPSFLPEGLESLRLFVEFADVFLLVQVQEGARGDAEKEAVLALLRAEAGVVRGGSASNEGVAEHKILFYSTPIGKQAIVRQLRPQLHIDSDREVVTNLVPHISRLLLVDGNFTDRLDSVAFRVLASLGSLLVLLPLAEESGESGSSAVPPAAVAAAAAQV